MRFGAFSEQTSPTIITLLRLSRRSCIVSVQLTSAFVSSKFDTKDISAFEPGPPTSQLHQEVSECYDLPAFLLFDLTFLIQNNSFQPLDPAQQQQQQRIRLRCHQQQLVPTILVIPGIISSAASSCNCLGDTRVGEIIWPPCVWPTTSWRCKMPALSFPQASASTPPMRSSSATTSPGRSTTPTSR